MVVLVIGSEKRKETSLLSDAVEDRGCEAVTCDVNEWPGDEPLTVTADGDDAAFGSRIEYDDVTGAYVDCNRFFRPYDPRFRDRLEEEFTPTLNQLREHRAMFNSLCRILDWHGADVVPHHSNHHWHDQKPWQLYLYETIDVPTPDTVFTNDPDEVESFYEAHDRVVFKPVTGGASPRVMTDEDVAEDRLDELATAPVQFQEYVEGDDVRAYVLDGELVGAIRYESESFSFKLDVEAGRDVGVEPVTLSDEVVDTVVRATEQAGLTYAAADVRLQQDGTHALLELNQVPVFAAADTEAGQDVAGALAEFLVS